MRRALGSVLPTLLLLTALAACGDDHGTAEGPGSTSSTPSASGSDGALDFTLVDTITVTAAGGQVSPTAVDLSDEAAVQEFVSQFTSPELTQRVTDAVAGADVGGRVLFGAVIAIGCDSPDQVAVAQSGDDVTVTALKVAKPQQECFAPMTTVALVTVPGQQ